MTEDDNAKPDWSWLLWMIGVALIAVLALFLSICPACRAKHVATASIQGVPASLRGDICYGNVQPQDAPATAPGDDAFTWKCEATLRRDASDGLHWFRDASEYRVLAQETYARAADAAQGFAGKYQASGFIVIMDADETLVDNSDYQKENEACGLRYWEPSWCDWNRAQSAGAVPGAAAFTQRVRALGGYVAVVSNRKDAYRAWTISNLDNLSIAHDAVLLSTGTSDKTKRWQQAVVEIAKIHAKPGQPAPPAVMWIGDQISDFPQLDASGNVVGALGQANAANALPDGFDTQFFLLPQPLYGGWTGNARR